MRELHNQDYGVALVICKGISFIGWIISIIGLLTFLSYLFLVAEADKDYSLEVGISLAAFFIGMFWVAVGQFSRAMLDTANYTREILNILQDLHLNRSAERKNEPVISL